MDEIVLNKLKEIFGDRLFLELSDRVSYGYDASFGQYEPEAVVQVKSAEEVQQVILLASNYTIPIYPRGAVTSLSGRPLPVHGGIVLDFSQWTDKLAIYPEDLVIKVSPGVKTKDIHELAEAHNLMYAPDPSSA